MVFPHNLLPWVLLIFQESCFHYAICYYDTQEFYDLFPPGDDNVGEEGKPLDEMGREILYTCQTCVPKKPVGYKAYFVHMVAVHGELQTLLERDLERPGAQNVLDSYKAAREEEESKGHVQPRDSAATAGGGGANAPKSNEPKSAKCREGYFSPANRSSVSLYACNILIPFGQREGTLQFATLLT